MTASLTGKTEALKVLLGAGASVNAAEPVRGQTSLMWAASEGNAAAADLLIEVRRRSEREIEGRLHTIAFRDPERPPRYGQGPARSRRQRQRRRARRDERAEHGRRECLFRAGRRAARPRRGPERSRSARIGSSHLGVPPEARRRRRRRRRQYPERAAAADRQPQRHPTREAASRTRRQSERPHRLGGAPVRQGRRHDAESAADPARTSLPHLQRRDAFLHCRPQRRRRVHAPPRAARRRREHQECAEHHAADRRLRPRLLGRRNTRPLHRRVGGGTNRSDQADASNWATTSTPTPISATTRWKAIPSTCSSITR